jgi:phage virion morphogenesis (putative tail completion) protein
MEGDIDQIDAFARGLLENLTPARRRALAAAIAARLRTSQALRIATQRNPDGTPYATRKPQKRYKRGRIRRTMFARLRLNKHLKAKATPTSASVEFTGRTERIARVHQFGLRDRVNRIRNLTVQYPERQILGFSDADLQMVESLVIESLART